MGGPFLRIQRELHLLFDVLIPFDIEPESFDLT